MISPDYAKTMATYNAWMNSRIYDAAAGLSDAQRKRDLGAFFKSIHGTLNHMLLTDRLWLGRFCAKPFQIVSLDQELHTDFAELRAQREHADAEIIAWVETLDDERLAATLGYTSVVNPQPRRFPFWCALTHFFNHQTHHRGQVTTLLTVNGVDPGVTDLIWLLGPVNAIAKLRQSRQS